MTQLDIGTDMESDRTTRRTVEKRVGPEQNTNPTPEPEHEDS